ncbi:anti-sigma factor [Rheinheimera baltica]|uniref:anti-sigma factor n=1 Tax=Rheinheimera baltica TaxID=67576 RepID=UPI00273D71E0|nr:anti-sigma factor [Rheinheimera baltica]MDP5148356.1 anti-sigma factor [Rheinheimera baltica]MDP5191089.1 anti-sigma factor [Rheinheimera baltica]
MKYQDQDLLDALAVDFILGAMRGAARRRFQQLIMANPAVRQTVWRWEQHLNPLAESLPATLPNQRVWQRIQQRLGWTAPEVTTLPAKRRPVWVGLALAASLLLAVVMLKPMLTSPLQQDIAVIQTSDAKAWWLVSKAERKLTVKATAAVGEKQLNDYQLWMLPADGAAPVSLGLLPQQGEQILDWPAAADGITIAALAVSLEPLGGSPTGLPTGPVLFTAEIITL